MKLNKTLQSIENGATIYGRKMYDRVLNFKDVESIGDGNNGMTIIRLKNGKEISCYYSEMEY